MAVPTEKDRACAWTNSGTKRKIPDEAKVRAKDLSIHFSKEWMRISQGNDLSQCRETDRDSLDLPNWPKRRLLSDRYSPLCASRVCAPPHLLTRDCAASAGTRTRCTGNLFRTVVVFIANRLQPDCFSLLSGLVEVVKESDREGSFRLGASQKTSRK